MTKQIPADIDLMFVFIIAPSRFFVFGPSINADRINKQKIPGERNKIVPGINCRAKESLLV
jgi:hypothetical protein